MSETKFSIIKQINMNYFEIGNQWFDKRDYTQAIENYKKELEVNPKDLKTLIQLCCAFYEIKAYHQSLNVSEEVLRIDPENEIILLRRGICFHELRMFEHAERVFTELIEYRSNNPYAYLNRADVRKYLEDKNGSEIDLAKFEFLSEDELDPIFSLDAIERPFDLDMHAFNKAIKEFLDVIVKDMKSYEAYYNLGIAYDRILAYKSASNSYSKALDLYENGIFERALYKRVNAYYNNKEYGEAYKDIHTYNANFPQNLLIIELKEKIEKIL